MTKENICKPNIYQEHEAKSVHKFQGKLVYSPEFNTIQLTDLFTVVNINDTLHRLNFNLSGLKFVAEEQTPYLFEKGANHASTIKKHDEQFNNPDLIPTTTHVHRPLLKN